MAMTYWTIEYGGVEKSLADWGIADAPRRRRSNMAPDLLSVVVPGAMDAAAVFAYGQPVIVRRDRAGAAGGGFSGGAIWFQGKAVLPRRFGRGGEEGVQYDFAGPWWDFERLVFQQEWKSFTGYTDPEDPTSDPVFEVKRASEVFLCQAADGTKLTTGGQIQEAINWAITCGVSVQLGTIDPAVDVPIYNARDLTVAEVIVQMMRWSPDCVAVFDYSTTPATLNIRALANLPNATVGPATHKVQELDLVPHHDLVLPAVCLRFKVTNSEDGRPWTQVLEQNAPVDATGQELGASVHTIELQGSQSSSVYGNLVCAPCLAQSTAANRVKWWKGDATLGLIGKEPLLASDKIDPASLTITSAVIEDKDGNAVSLATFPNELLDGSGVAPWMTVGGNPVSEVGVKVKALATYDLYRVANGWTQTNAAKFLIQQKRTKELSVNIRLTNGVTGSYSTLDSFTAAEPVPEGLAASILASHAVLQYEGSITLVDSEVPAGVGMGYKLTINTGSTTYANQLIQSVTEDMGAGTITLDFGPAVHLGIVDLIELLRVNRYRLVYNNPATRSSGTGTGGASVTLGKSQAKENTTGGLGNADMFGLSSDLGSGKTAVLQSNAAGKSMLLEVQNADGTRDTTHGSVELKLEDTLGTDGTKHEVKLQQVLVCIQGNRMAAIASISEPFDPTAP